MPVRLALCDLGAPGGGEPWFPHSAVLVLPHDFLWFVCVFCCFFDRHFNPISIPLMMQWHYRVSLLAVSLLTMPMCLVFLCWLLLFFLCLWGLFSVCCLLFVDYPFGIMTAPLDCVLVQQHGFLLIHLLTRWKNLNCINYWTICIMQQHGDRPGGSQEAMDGKKGFNLLRSNFRPFIVANLLKCYFKLKLIWSATAASGSLNWGGPFLRAYFFLRFED